MYKNRNRRTPPPWETRPPPFNPYGANNNNINYKVLLKTKILPILLISSLLAVWFLTPIPDFVTSLILLTVPISSDVELGLESWTAINQAKKYQSSYDYWNIESIGYDLVNSVINNKERYRQFCKGPASKFQFLQDLFIKDDCMEQARQYNWSFTVIKSPELNAFALPGGIIRVTDTLLRTLNLSNGEIAALLSHEMSHVLYRHGQSQLLKKNLIETIVKALFYDDHDEYNESFGEAVGELLYKSASFLGQMRFSRQNEYEADDGAWELLAQSKLYNPKSVEYLLRKLHSLESGKGGAGTSSYFAGWDRTHPGTVDRIKVLDEKWHGLSWSQQQQHQRFES